MTEAHKFRVGARNQQRATGAEKLTINTFIFAMVNF